VNLAEIDDYANLIGVQISNYSAFSLARVKCCGISLPNFRIFVHLCQIFLLRSRFAAAAVASALEPAT
jgi:hypothetical protein